MLSDWNATERLEIPANAHVSLSMQGHMIDRGLTHGDKSGARSNGEVIIVQEGAVLTINGGPRGDAHMHEVYAYQSAALYPVNPARVDNVSGGYITGGSSTNGAGGIHVKKGATLTLNDVTVGGCRAESKSPGSSGGLMVGYGGGIYVAQDKVLLKNLVIRGNQAGYGGGAYFAPGPSDESKYAGDTVIDGCTITGNSANASGGGVYCDEYSAANGKRKRTLSGAMVIKDNDVKNGSDYRNLCIASSAWSAKDESFNLSEGSEVWASWAKQGNLSRNSANKDSDCAQYLQSDQPGYCFAYNVGQRYINRVTDEEAPTVPAAVTVSAANANDASDAGKTGSNTVASKVGTVGAGGSSGNDYDSPAPVAGATTSIKPVWCPPLSWKDAHPCQTWVERFDLH